MQLQSKTHPDSLGAAECLPPSPRESGAAQRPLTDLHYVLRVIRHLARTRIERGLSLAEVARRAGLKRSLIDHAEQDCQIPNCHDLKAWSAALGFDWEQVWSECLPGR